MTETQDILFDISGQSLVLDCPDGRPTSVTSVRVLENDADDTATEEAATTGSASVEVNPNTTLAAAAGASEDDPRAIVAGSATGIAIGRTYRVANAAGEYEDVEVVSGSGTTFGIRHPLKNDYAATTSTLKSTRVSISLSDTWVADSANVSPAFSPSPRYRVRWTVVVGGATKVYDRYFDLVRYAAQHGVLPTHVAQRAPHWLDWLPPDHRDDQGRDLIRRAWTEVKFDLYGDSIADQALRNAEARDKLVIDRALLLSLEDQVLAGGSVSPDALGLARRIYEQRFNGLIRTPVTTVDKGGHGGASTNEPTRLWRR